MNAVTTSPPRTQPTLTISDLARSSGAAPSAIRFYEKHGLVVSERTAGNQRRFYEVEGCIVKIIRVAQRVGLSVAEIRQLLSELPDRPVVTPTDWLALRHRLEHDVRARLQTLNQALDDLTSEQRLCEIPPRGKDA